MLGFHISPHPCSAVASTHQHGLYQHPHQAGHQGVQEGAGQSPGRGPQLGPGGAGLALLQAGAQPGGAGRAAAGGGTQRRCCPTVQ